MGFWSRYLMAGCLWCDKSLPYTHHRTLQSPVGRTSPPTVVAFWHPVLWCYKAWKGERYIYLGLHLLGSRGSAQSGWSFYIRHKKCFGIEYNHGCQWMAFLNVHCEPMFFNLFIGMEHVGAFRLLAEPTQWHKGLFYSKRTEPAFFWT